MLAEYGEGSVFGLSTPDQLVGGQKWQVQYGPDAAVTRFPGLADDQACIARPECNDRVVHRGLGSFDHSAGSVELDGKMRTFAGDREPARLGGRVVRAVRIILTGHRPSCRAAGVHGPGSRSPRPAVRVR
jgi:hypothetical protein